MRPRFEVADIIRRFLPSFEQKHHPPVEHVHILKHLSICRTEALGGHVDGCPQCGHTHISYNSCRNRHCPKCQGIKREEWIENRKQEFLPVKYFHVVFTLPAALHRLCLANKQILYSILFKSAWQTLTVLAADEKYMGATPAMTALLHTWGSNLQYHPHLHCIVPAGGVKKAKWKYAKGAHNNTPYLFPVKAMGTIFRAKFMALLDKSKGDLKKQLLHNERKSLFHSPWVIYAKAPLHGKHKVIEYIGRYTNRVAITNNRILDINDKEVTFRYKDYKDGARNKEMVLDGTEFLRRFTLHILPKGFVHIRHYGFLAPSNREQLIKLQVALDVTPCPKKRVKKDWRLSYKERFNKEFGLCPACQKAIMQTIATINPARAPPGRFINGHNRIGNTSL